MNFKNTIILITVLLSVSILLIVVGIASLSTKKQLAPSPSPTPLNTNFEGENNYTSPKTNLNYVPGSAGKNLQSLFNRKQLSPQDTAVKTNLLKLINQDSGNLFFSEEFSVDYVRGPDDFEVEITTQNIDQAKAEAIKWFKGQGFSDQGICNLPVSFYLIDIVKNKLPKQTAFDPNPPNCQLVSFEP